MWLNVEPWIPLLYGNPNAGPASASMSTTRSMLFCSASDRGSYQILNSSETSTSYGIDAIYHRRDSLSQRVSTRTFPFRFGRSAGRLSIGQSPKSWQVEQVEDYPACCVHRAPPCGTWGSVFQLHTTKPGRFADDDLREILASTGDPPDGFFGCRQYSQDLSRASTASIGIAGFAPFIFTTTFSM